MRIICVLVFSFLLAPLVSVSALAAENARHTTSFSSFSSPSDDSLIAVGVADTNSVSGGESVSAMFSSKSNWIQAYLAVYSTKVNFDFAIGGAYKFTLAGTRSTGFHIGPGFTVGTVADDFAFAIFGAAGGHFSITDHFMFSVDAGPMITHTKNNTNFRLRPLGQLLGLSAFYVF